MNIKITDDTLHKVKGNYLEFAEEMGKENPMESFAILFPLNLVKLKRVYWSSDDFTLLETSNYLRTNNPGRVNAGVWNILNRASIKYKREGKEDALHYYVNLIHPTKISNSFEHDNPLLLVEVMFLENYFKVNPGLAQFRMQELDSVAKSVISVGVRDGTNPYWIAANYNFLNSPTKTVGIHEDKLVFMAHGEKLEALLKEVNVPLVKTK